MIRRLSVLAAATLMVLGMIAGPAAAHILVVEPPGGGQGPGEEAQVGGGALPDAAKGQGLIEGGPPWDRYLQSPAHGKGLNTACESLWANGNGVVDIYGPPTPAGCPHGT